MRTSALAERSAFIQKQLEFAAHIRDPARNPRPADVEERRMAIYRDLFYNNVEGFVSSSFPVLRSLYEDLPWHRLVRSFFTCHRCRTPYFLEIAREFLHYLEHEHKNESSDPPFLLELAHYEWVELALQIDDETVPAHDIDPQGDLLTGIPVLSSLAWPLSYRYPVHRISRDFRPQEPGAEPAHLLVLRDRSDRVRFNEINAVTARLLALLRENQSHSGHALLLRIANELPHSNIDTVVAGGLQILEDLRRQDVVLGVRRAAC